MQDERLGLPSASSFTITACCPGSEALIRSLPPANEKQDEQTLRGLRIHRAWQTGDTSELLEDELEDYTRTLELSSRLDSEWRAGGNGDVRVIKESRLWLHDHELNPIASGQFDECLVSPPHALVKDLKSGWCKNLSPSQESWQLRLLAVLVANEYGCNSIQVAFIKPKIKRDHTDLTHYFQEDIVRAERSIRDALWRSRQDDQQRVPGAHCRYCRGRHVCPEAATYAMVPFTHCRLPTGAEKAEVVSAVQSLTPEHWKYLWQHDRITRTILDAAKECLKGLSDEDLTAIGLKKVDGKKLSPITAIAAAFHALRDGPPGYSLTEEALLNCMKFDKEKLVDAMRATTGWGDKEAKQKLFKEILEPYIEVKSGEKSITEI
jgi:hypothetical protein